jgi:hypothetical protein
MPHMGRSWAFGGVVVVMLLVAPLATTSCGLCIHLDCGPSSVTVFLTPDADGSAHAARICFDGRCETIERADAGGGRTFERALPEIGAVDDADDVGLSISLLDASGAELATFTDDIDIDPGECECDSVEMTWNGTEFDRFN